MYICVEGCDGTGKDTQADALVARYEAQVHPVLRLNEPDSTQPTGRLLRQMLKDGTYIKSHAAMFLADRMALLSERVVPFLEQSPGEPGTKPPVVISSRCFLSTMVYQQENWPLEWLLALHDQLPRLPDRLIILDLPAEVALERSRQRPGPNEYYERIEVQERNRQRYLDLATSPVIGRYVAPEGTTTVIDASGTPQEVARRIEDSI